MPTIRIHQGEKRMSFSAKPKENLMSVLQKNHVLLSAPCGGKGTCNKCEVEIQTVGKVKSCNFLIENDIVIELDEKGESVVEKRASDLLCSVQGKGKEIGYGVAIDLGTTTVAASLREISSGKELTSHGVENPQVAFGADVVSRIDCCLKTEGLELLHACICKTVNDLIQELAMRAEIASKDIVDIVVAGNTTMLHLLLRQNPSGMAMVPFTPRFLDEQTCSSQSLGIYIHPQAKVHALPSFSSFVGSDISAGLTSIAPTKGQKNILLVDIGTNGEIALLTPAGAICTATAAGPAFEGATITCGMSAMDGAINRFDWENGAQIIGNGPAKGICGSGLIDLVAHLLDRGTISIEGSMETDFLISGEHGEPTIYLTPSDVRELQLAKSAIYSGIVLLLGKANLKLEEVDQVYLAGGFGSYISIESAVRIGLLPIELKDKISRVGNASLAGAVRGLCNDNFVNRMQEIINSATIIDLGDDPNFELEYAMNMFFQ